jgi:hypothetical protein
MLVVILTIFCCCFLVERVFPGWKLPDVPTWPKRVVLINLVQLGVVLIAGISWEGCQTCLCLSCLPILGQLLAGYSLTFCHFCILLVASLAARI